MIYIVKFAPLPKVYSEQLPEESKSYASVKWLDESGGREEPFSLIQKRKSCK